MQHLTVPQGTFALTRYPARANDSFRAWDAADEYLLHHLAEDDGLPSTASVLLVNDAFGALATALAAHRPHLVSDWVLVHEGTRANLARNSLDADAVTLHDSLHHPPGSFDTVLIKMPKSLAMLEDQLYRLRSNLHADTRIIGAGMTKHIHTSTLQLFERILGPTRTSLARKKARLIFCALGPARIKGTSPFPVTWPLEGTDFIITNHAGVFSAQRLDMGTRLIMQHIPASDASRHIIDLGCGNGVLALVAAQRNPNATVACYDASFMAVASARATLRAAFGDNARFSFAARHSLDGVPSASADLILNNPPFHQRHATTDATALTMFADAHRVLRRGGELMVIGNRHLGYHTKLKRLFGGYRLVAEDKKFVIWQVQKR